MQLTALGETLNKKDLTTANPMNPFNLFTKDGRAYRKEVKYGTSLSDLSNLDLFNSQFKIGENGLSDFTEEQIRAKAATLGFSDSLVDEAAALGKDADLSTIAKGSKITYADAMKDTRVSTMDLANSLKESNLLNEGNAIKLTEAMERGVGDTQNVMKELIEDSEEVGNAFVTMGTQMEKGVSSSGNLLTGLMASLESMLPIIFAVAAAFAAYEIWDSSQTKYTKAQNDYQDKASKYQEEANKLANINSQLDQTKEKLNALRAAKKAGSLTLTDEVELEKLEKQNDQLETQKKIQDDITKQKREATAKAAHKAFTTNKSLTEYSREKDGNFLGTIEGLGGSIGHVLNTIFGFGDDSADPIKAFQKEEGTKIGKNKYDTSEIGMLKKSVKNYEEELDKLNGASSQDEIDNIQYNIDKYQEEMSDGAAKIQKKLKSITDDNGNPLSGYSADYDKLTEALNEASNAGKSDDEKALSTLDTYFKSTSGSMIKKQLDDIAKSGGNAQDALDAFNQSGIDLKTLDVSTDQFTKYFKEIKSAAGEAGDAVKSYESTFSEMKTASSTANQGANFDDTKKFYKTAKSAYKEGLVGTDDFKSVAQFGVDYDISEAYRKDQKKSEKNRKYKYESDAYTAAWKKSQKIMERWYGGSDENQNMHNVMSDFVNNGLARSLGGGDYSFKNKDGSKMFATTAKAAEKLHTSVANVENVMGKLEEHGFEFDGIQKSGELLDKYKTSLDKIKELRDSLSEGSTQRQQLTNMISGWDQEYGKYEKDMSKLTKKQVVEIEFQYDLASVKQKVNELKSTAEATGTSEDWAKYLVGQETEANMLETHYKKAWKDDKSYKKNYQNKKSSLMEKRNSTDNEDERLNYNKQMSALDTMQESFFTFKNSGGDGTFKDYVSSYNGNKVLKKIQKSTGLSSDQLSSTFGIKVDVKVDKKKLQKSLGIESDKDNVITMKADCDTSQIKKQLKDLQDGETLKFNTEVKDQNGNTINGDMTVTQKDGKKSYSFKDEDGKKYSATQGKDGSFTIVVKDTNGKDGKDGKKGDKGDKGEDGKDGKDGKSEKKSEKTSDKKDESPTFPTFTNKKEEPTLPNYKNKEETPTIKPSYDDSNVKKGTEKSKEEVEKSDPTLTIDTDTTNVEKGLKAFESEDGKQINLSVDADMNMINKELASLETGQTLVFSANVDGVEQRIAAVKNEDGTISYVGMDNGVQVYLQKVKHKDGTITYTLGKYPKKVPKAKQVVDRTPNNNKVKKDAPGIGQKVTRNPDNSKVKSDLPPLVQKVTRTISEIITSGGKKSHSMNGAHGTQQFNGTAHAYGTAKATGDWSVKKSGPALVGELGREILRQCIVICI